MTNQQPNANVLLGAASSILISAGFALAWGISGSLALSGIWRTVALILSVVFSLSLGGVGLRFYRRAGQKPDGTGTSPGSPFQTVAYRVAVVVMLVAFPIAGNLLTRSGHSEAILPVVTIIVGLHFLGLVSAFRNSAFTWEAGAFCVLGVAGLFVPTEATQMPPFNPRVAVLGLGCALILWLSVSPLVLSISRQLAGKQT